MLPISRRINAYSIYPCLSSISDRLTLCLSEGWCALFTTVMSFSLFTLLRFLSGWRHANSHLSFRAYYHLCAMFYKGINKVSSFKLQSFQFVAGALRETWGICIMYQGHPVIWSSQLRACIKIFMYKFFYKFHVFCVNLCLGRQLRGWREAVTH